MKIILLWKLISPFWILQKPVSDTGFYVIPGSYLFICNENQIPDGYSSSPDICS